MDELVQSLIESGCLRTERIISAFSDIHRIDFVPDDLKSAANMDIPLPIGHGQTISQPQTVAFMMELLNPQPGQRILDVGSGSGWTTTLLAHVAGEKGTVIGMERISELCKIGRKNLEKYGYASKGIAEIECADGTKGWPRHAPYERILVSASGEKIPEELKKQLAIGGKMVIPVSSSIFLVEKKTETEFHLEEFKGFSFVPLVEGSNM